MEGFVTSAGSGSESILRVSRAALVSYLVHASADSLVAFYESLVQMLKSNVSSDRLSTPILEVLGFLLDTKVLGRLRIDKLR